ncbi:Alkaline serine exoprotease A [Diplonema papillatum]|nr:Alkaline serine exoprotease A [Diplonema papillatum]
MHDRPLILSTLLAIYVVDGTAQVPADKASLGCPDTTATSSWSQKRATNAVSLGESWIHNSSWGAGTTLYVLDTGVNCAHAEFGDRCTDGFNSVSTENASDLDGHGTLAASIAAGSTVGIAPAANVVSVKCVDSRGEVKEKDVVDAMDWVVKTHKATGSGVAVLLTDIRGPLTTIPLATSFESAIGAGIIVVTSAGIVGASACSSYPGALPGVITVGSTTIKEHQGGTRDEVTESSGQECVDIFAPGEMITGARNVVGEYRKHSSTSVSASIVAGMLLSYISTNPTATPDEAWTWLEENAQSGLGNLEPGAPDLLAHIPCVEDPPAPIDSDRHAENCFGVYEVFLASTLAYPELQVAANDQKCYKVQCPVGTTRVLAGVHGGSWPVRPTIAFNGEPQDSDNLCSALAVSPRDSMVMRVATGGEESTVKAMMSCQEERWTRIRTSVTTFATFPAGLAVEYASNLGQGCVTCDTRTLSFLRLSVSNSICFFPPEDLQTARLTASADAGSFRVQFLESRVASASSTKRWYWSSRGMPFLGGSYGGGDGLAHFAIPRSLTMVVRIKVGAVSGNGTLRVRFDSADESCTMQEMLAQVGVDEEFYFAAVCRFGGDVLTQVQVESLGPAEHELEIRELAVFGSGDDFPSTYAWLGVPWNTLNDTTLSFASNPIIIYDRPGASQ